MQHRARQMDLAIQEAVLGELRWDSRVNSTDIGVTVHQGVVTLTGTVESLSEKLAAQESAYRIADVLDVANDIEIKTGKATARSDTDIASAVRHALEWNSQLDADKIRSSVSLGDVTLEGEVESLNDRNEAESLVRQLTGVHAVTNRLKVVPPSTTPHEVRCAIASALDRQLEREARRIQIDVDGGIVTLSGTVHSWAERRAVIGAVSTLRGVAGLNDRLAIERTT